jgi:hypothetical protein
MRRSSWTLALSAAPSLVAAHTGDHSVLSTGSGLMHMVAEHWGWLCGAALLAIVYAAGSARRAKKEAAKRRPIR